MALINCPECNKQISDMAQVCPHCGFPMLNKRGSKITIKNATGEDLCFETSNNSWRIDPGQTLSVNFTQGGCFRFSYTYDVVYKIYDRDVGNIETSNYYVCSNSANFLADKNYEVTIESDKTMRTVYHSNGGFWGKERAVDKSGRDKMYLKIKIVP